MDSQKVTHRDYPSEKEGGGASEQWMQNNVDRNEVYVLESDRTPAGMFRIDLADERWVVQEPVAIRVRKGFNGQGL